MQYAVEVRREWTRDRGPRRGSGGACYEGQQHNEHPSRTRPVGALVGRPFETWGPRVLGSSDYPGAAGYTRDAGVYPLPRWL